MYKKDKQILLSRVSWNDVMRPVVPLCAVESFFFAQCTLSEPRQSTSFVEHDDLVPCPLESINKHCNDLCKFAPYPHVLFQIIFNIIPLGYNKNFYK